MGEYISGSNVGNGGIYNTINFHVYHYAGNNPIKYTDPDGRAINFIAAAIGAAVGAGIGAAVAWASGGSGKDIAAAAVGGAVSGGMAGLTMGGSLVAQMGTGALAAAAGHAAGNLVSGNETTVGGLALSAAGGAAGVAAGKLVEAGANALGKVVSAASDKVSQAAGNAKETTVIGRVKDLQNLPDGQKSLLDRLPDQGSPKANWKQNSGILRQEMNKGLPILDKSPGDNDGQFLNAERNLLKSRGWEFDEKTNFWNPPKE